MTYENGEYDSLSVVKKSLTAQRVRIPYNIETPLGKIVTQMTIQSKEYSRSGSRAVFPLLKAQRRFYPKG